MTEYEMTLNSPMTHDDWAKITDANMEHAKSVTFQTDGGKKAEFIKVVRCKDCKYAHMTYDGKVKYCDRISIPDDEGNYGYALYLPGDWFCADGEVADKNV